MTFESVTSYDIVLGQLKTLGLLVRRGANGWSAKCPAHEDNSPSLTVRFDAKTRKVMLKCHRGCDYVAIRQALENVEVSDHSEERDSLNGREAKQLEPVPWGDTCGDMPDFWHKDLSRPSDIYAYWLPGTGGLWSYVCRWDRPEGKQVRPYSLWRHKDGSFRWHWLLPPGPRPLYLAEPIRPGKNFLVVEGEKTARAAWFRYPELNAVTWLGGASAVDKTDWSPLADQTVILLPDNDTPGFRAMEKVMERLLEIGATVYWAQPPAGAPLGWDLADDLPPGITIDQIVGVNHVLRMESTANRPNAEAGVRTGPGDQPSDRPAGSAA